MLPLWTDLLDPGARRALHLHVGHLNPRTMLYLFVGAVVLLMADRVRQNLGLDDDFPLVGIVTFGTALDRYRSWMWMAGHEQRTITDYSRTLKAFTDTLPRDGSGEPRWHARNLPKHLERWLGQPAKSGPNRGGPKSVATRAHETMIARRFYHWCSSISAPPLLTRNPLAGVISPRVGEGPPRDLPDEMVAAILELAEKTDERMGMMCWLAWAGGLRCMEIAGARIERFRVSEQEITLLVHGKGRKQRIIPLHPAAHQFIRKYLIRRPQTGPLVEGRDHNGQPTGRPMKPATVSVTMGRWLRANGFPASAHQLRHSIATAIYRAGEGTNIDHLQQFLGHASANTTRRYAKGYTLQVGRWLERVPDPRDIPGDSPRPAC
ncbi:MAG TPA: tyrosine-type recombinase/integrase [Actinomycetes bacterium]|nr:tyrosine-type recombinase/integrase [Actinomycetes bacterium]